MILVLGHGELYGRSFYMPKSELVKEIPDSEIYTVDISPFACPTEVVDLRNPKLSCPDNYFDFIFDACGIFSNDNYEYPNFWKEMFRVLKIKGVFYPRTPNYLGGKTANDSFRNIKGIKIKNENYIKTGDFSYDLEIKLSPPLRKSLYKEMVRYTKMIEKDREDRKRPQFYRLDSSAISNNK